MSGNLRCEPESTPSETTDSDLGKASRMKLMRLETSELSKSLAEVRGQAQFLLYLADQIDESVQQLKAENDASHASFLCKLLGMYTNQLESKQHGLSDKISETCQEVLVAIQEIEFDRDF